MAGVHRQGTVAEVDPAAGTVRLKFGSNEHGDFLSADIPYSQTGGDVKFHNPPSVGQQMMAISPGGDLRQAIAIPTGFAAGGGSPGSAGNEHVLTFGSVTMTLTGGSLVIASGGVSVEIGGAGLTITGGAVTHDGVNIGKDHIHLDVTPGGGLSGPPQP